MNIHATTGPLKMRQMPLEPLPDMPEFRAMLDLYESKRNGRAMPCWKDFSFSEFVGWHTRIALSMRRGDDFWFRIFGSTFVELFGRDLTGENLLGSIVPEQVSEAKQHFKKLVEGPMLGVSAGRVPFAGRGFREFDVLHLPLADHENAVSHCLHVTSKPRERAGKAFS